MYYTLGWGKLAGQRYATGLFTFADPITNLERKHNKETILLLDIKKAQMLIDAFSVGLKRIPSHRYKHNFLDFYKEYVNNNKQYGNKHLECSYNQFKNFVNSTFISPQEVTEGLSGYFPISPGLNLPVKTNKIKKKRDNLEVNEYIQLLHTPSGNEEVREAFIICCYTGLRWCDVKLLTWNQLKHDSIILTLHQKKTTVEHYIKLHPIAQAISSQKESQKKGIHFLLLPARCDTC